MAIPSIWIIDGYCLRIISRKSGPLQQRYQWEDEEDDEDGGNFENFPNDRGE